MTDILLGQGVQLAGSAANVCNFDRRVMQARLQEQKPCQSGVRRKSLQRVVARKCSSMKQPCHGLASALLSRNAGVVRNVAAPRSRSPAMAARLWTVPVWKTCHTDV